jgi:alpha-tubulin suppressor-like RCC1 family protein
MPPAAVQGLAQAVAVATTRLSSCALRRGGDVVCWGQPLEDRQAPRSTRNYELTPVPGLTDARSLSGGCFHACALTAGGGVACWGENGFGQLGDGGTARANAVLVAGVTSAVEVSAGCWHTCARSADGDVSCWGRNVAGELGDETTEDRRRPVTVHGLHGATRVAAGEHHTCALSGGAVLCWGGDSTLSPRAALVGAPRPPLPLAFPGPATELALGRHILVVEDAQGALHCQGAYCPRSDRGQEHPSTEAAPVPSFGANGEGL